MNKPKYKKELEGFDTCQKTEFRILGYNDCMRDWEGYIKGCEEKIVKLIENYYIEYPPHPDVIGKEGFNVCFSERTAKAIIQEILKESDQ